MDHCTLGTARRPTPMRTAHGPLGPPRRWGRWLCLLPYSCLLGLGAWAQAPDHPAPAHQTSTPGTHARYEIMQSPLTVRWTFRLDRVSGRVWHLSKTPEDNNRWEEMTIFDPPRVAANAPNRARFQLFASGLGSHHTFLLDADTGKTWTAVTHRRKNPDGTETEFPAWQAFSEDKGLSPAP